jgi:hypothetical protein
MASASITASLIPGQEYLLSTTFEGVIATYNGVPVFGPGLNGRFIAVDGVNTIILNSEFGGNGTLSVTRYLRNLYDIIDGQAGVFAFQNDLNKWTSKYSYSPESFCTLGNRLVTFKSGIVYTHDSQTFNSFYGQVYDSQIAFPHNEGGNTIKTYDTLAIEGDQPSRVHIRTEVPYVQSSDLVSTDFRVKEGVNYAPIYRDRLSPNVAGTAVDKMYKGDRMRGELGKFQVVFSQPSSLKQLKFVDINFDNSTGQTV